MIAYILLAWGVYAAEWCESGPPTLPDMIGTRQILATSGWNRTTNTAKVYRDER